MLFNLDWGDYSCGKGDDDDDDDDDDADDDDIRLPFGGVFRSHFEI